LCYQTVATGKISMWKNEETAKINKRKDAGFSKNVKGKVHPRTGNEDLYRPYGP